MPKITTILVGALSAATFAIISMPVAAQYYGGVPLGAVKPTLPGDVTNLLFRSRVFAAADGLENGGAELKVGYRFSSHVVPHFALVGQYAANPRWGGQRTAFDGGYAAKKTNTYGLDLVGTLPLFDRLSITANAGVARVRADTVFGGEVPIGLLNPGNGTYTSAGRIGLGVQYDFSRRLGFRFGVERYRNLNGNAYSGGNGDADTFSFGMRIRF